MRIINEALLAEFRTRGSCELCGRKIYPLDPDHLHPKGMGGGSRLDIRLNLAALCRLCHSENQEGGASRSKILVLIARREQVLCEWIVEVRHLFLRLPKDCTEQEFTAALEPLSLGAYVLAVKTWEEIPKNDIQASVGRHERSGQATSGPPF